MGDMTGPKIAFTIPILGGLNVTESTIIGWVIIAVVTGLVLWMTHDMQKVPTKKQAVAEWLVATVNKMVRDSMGKNHMNYAPYIAALFTLSILGSLVSLLGLRSMTADFSVTVTWALICFAMITYNKFKYGGVKGYLKGFAEPVPFMLPMNIISEIATPVSMAFRHFGNIAGGMVITTLLYFALSSASKAIGLPIPLLTIGIPAVLSVYFDLFSGFMQAFIFSMLTMANVGGAIPDSNEK